MTFTKRDTSIILVGWKITCHNPEKCLSQNHRIIQVGRSCGKFLVQLPSHLSSAGSRSGQVWFIFVSPWQVVVVLALLPPSLHAWAMSSSIFLPRSPSPTSSLHPVSLEICHNPPSWPSPCPAAALPVLAATMALEGFVLRELLAALSSFTLGSAWDLL